METLTESSIAPELRNDSVIPTSPDEERTLHHRHHHHHNNNNDDDDDLANIIHPGNLHEEQSQSSQDSNSLMSPPPGGGGNEDPPEESIENIAKELQNNSCSDNASTDEGSQPEALHNTDSSSIPVMGSENPEGSTSPLVANTGQRIHIAPVSNGSLLSKGAGTGGKPTTMRDLDRKMNKSRGRPKRRAMVAMYQSEVSKEVC